MLASTGFNGLEISSAASIKKKIRSTSEAKNIRLWQGNLLQQMMLAGLKDRSAWPKCRQNAGFGVIGSPDKLGPRDHQV